MEATLQEVKNQLTYNELLDRVEVAMHQKGLISIETTSVFTPGLYTRSIIVPPDTWLLSYIHKNEHQFIMSKGSIVVFTEQDKLVHLIGPFLGKTQTGTRRLAKTVEETVWTSIHATDIYPLDNSQEAFDEAVRLVEAELYEKHENLLLIKLQEDLCLQ